MCNITYYIFISTYFFISKMPVLPKKVCNVSYHAPKEGKMGLQEGKNGRVIAKSTGKVQRRHRKGLALGSHWACAGLADVFAAALHKRRAGQMAKEKQGKARPKRQGTAKAQPRHSQGTQCTYTRIRIHIHIHYIIVFCSRMPLAGILWPWPWNSIGKFFCLLCIFCFDIPQTMPYNGAIK